MTLKHTHTCTYIQMAMKLTSRNTHIHIYRHMNTHIHIYRHMNTHMHTAGYEADINEYTRIHNLTHTHTYSWLRSGHQQIQGARGWHGTQGMGGRVRELHAQGGLECRGCCRTCGPNATGTKKHVCVCIHIYTRIHVCRGVGGSMRTNSMPGVQGVAGRAYKYS
jgi:hypothetical protein